MAFSDPATPAVPHQWAAVPFQNQGWIFSKPYVAEIANDKRLWRKELVEKQADENIRFSKFDNSGGNVKQARLSCGNSPANSFFDEKLGLHCSNRRYFFKPSSS